MFGLVDYVHVVTCYMYVGVSWICCGVWMDWLRMYSCLFDMRMLVDVFWYVWFSYVRIVGSLICVRWFN